MSPNPWRDWLAAERDLREDDADAALRSAFAMVPRPAPGDAFSRRVAEALARETRRQARVARWTMAAVGVAGLGLGIVVLLQLPRLFRPAFDAGVGGLVWSLAAVDRGMTAWSLIARMARALGALVVAPQGTLALMALAMVAIAALYGLNRVLELEERSSS